MLPSKIEAAATALLVPGAWAKGSEALDENSQSVFYDDSAACRWCAVGALKSAGATIGEIKTILQDHAWTYKRELTSFNDWDAKTAEQVAERLFALSINYRR